MAEISSAEVSKNFSRYREMADGSRGAAEPVLVLHYNKPSVVIVAADEYARLKRRDRVVGATEDLPEWLALQIARTEMDPRFKYLDEA
jgi:PHD/YefM family antitoxin component YafN of YafNO toxin-antitoxin module